MSCVRKIILQILILGSSYTNLCTKQIAMTQTNQTNQTNQSNDQLHGVTLEKMVTDLSNSYGWEALAQQIPIRCFYSEPSVASSLKFLRRTPWARAKVEALYLYALKINK
jgi:uncharacterized protein (DUF2132 family)